MIRKILFSLMLVALMSFQVVNAQICNPDLSITTPGIFPDSATGLPCAIIGAPYSVTITAVVPEDTVVIIGVPLDFWIDSIVLLAITGLPTGIVKANCNPLSCGFPGGTSGCVQIMGQTTGPVGLYPLEVFTRAYVTDKTGAFPQQQQNDTVKYYFINVVEDLVLDTISVTNTTSCGGNDGSIELSVIGGTGNYIYSWSPGGATSQNITGLTAGTYTVTVTDTSCSLSRNLIVTVADPGSVSVNTVSVTDVSVFGGDDGAIDITVTGGISPYTFSWTGPDGFTSDAEDLDTLSAGTYVLIVTDSNNCSSSLSENIGQPSGISEINARSFSIVQNNPNPFADKTEIIFTTVKTGLVEFKVYNVLGKLVYSENINAKTGINTIEFFTNNLPAGIYLYGLSDDKQRVVRKMVINGK